MDFYHQYFLNLRSKSCVVVGACCTWQDGSCPAHPEFFLFTLVRAADANLWQIFSASWMAAFTLSWFPHRQHKSELVWATAGWSASARRARYIWNIKIRIRFASISSKSQFCSIYSVDIHSVFHCSHMDLSHWPHYASSKASGLTEQRKTRMTG